jgi:hypothetical protein
VLFTKLMVAMSRPMYWQLEANPHPQALRTLLVHLLEPNKPGAGYARMSHGEANAEWLSGEKAIECLDPIYQLWNTVTDLLRVEGGCPSALYDELVTHNIDVFVDFNRIRSSLDVDSVEKLASGEPVYLGVSSDWSSLPTGLLWTPQLRAWNYWPTTTWAPEPISKVDDPPPRDGRQAAEVLEHRLLPIVVGLNRLPSQYGLGQADIRVGDTPAYPAIFYSAVPETVPAEPGKLLEEPWLEAIQEIARVTLGTPDILSEDVAGSYLEGRILTLRHEKETALGLGSFYLAIPWLPLNTGFANAEAALYRVTDLVAYRDTFAASELDDVTHLALVTDEWLALLRATLNCAGTLVDEVQQFIALTPTGRSQRDEASRLCEELRGAFLALESRLSTFTQAADGYETKWQLTVDRSADEVRNRFAIRPLPPLCAGLDQADGSAPFSLSRSVVSKATRNASDVRSQFARVGSSVRAMVESEKEATRWREEATRACSATA